MLEGLGFDASTEAVYRLVLEEPAWDIGKVTAHLGWEEDEVRAALDKLAELCLLEYDSGQSNFRPTNPGVGLSLLLSRSEADLVRRQRQLEATRAVVSALATEYGTSGRYDHEVIERLEGLSAVRRRLEELATVATTECLSLMPGGAQPPDTMDASKPLDQQALERGVAVRSIYQDSFRNDPATLEYVRWLSSMGGETRTVPVVPMLMVIVDQEIALVPLDPGNGRAGALELHSPGVVAAMRLLFEQFWTVATPFGQDAPVDRHGLSPQDQELVRLLAAGHTDEMVCRQLGLSLRTVRRMSSRLMERLGARSRFAAGVEACRRGWA